MVHAVEAGLVDIEPRQRRIGLPGADLGGAVDRGEIPDPPQQPRRDPRRAAGAGCDFPRPVRRQPHLQQRGGPRHDHGQIVDIVEIQTQRNAEAFAQRRGEQAGPGRGPDQGETRQVDPHRAGGRPLADHQVELIVLHGRVEQFLDRRIEAVDLVDEQHFAGLKVGQDRRQVAGARDHRAGGAPEPDAQFPRHDVRKRGLAEARRAVKQDMVHRFPPRARRFDENAQVGAHVPLADKIVEPHRPE